MTVDETLPPALLPRPRGLALRDSVEDARGRDARRPHGGGRRLGRSRERRRSGDGRRCVTPDAINFMARHARGLICLSLTAERCDELGSADDGRATHPASDRVHGLDRGRGGRHHRHFGGRPRAHDPGRGATPAASARTISSSPGHVFPLRARQGGVLVRTGQTEASVDLARLAGCAGRRDLRGDERRRHDGAAAGPDRLLPQHGLKIVTVAT